MAPRGSDWHIRTWARVHAKHGTFFVGMHEGEANAQRVYRSDPRASHTVEQLGNFDNVALAMIAVEKRITELDAIEGELVCHELRAYAENVA
jgi:hypothetical protein